MAQNNLGSDKFMNKKLLRSKMALNGDNDRKLAEKLKLTRNTFSNKINSKTKFKVKEMLKIKEMYSLTDKEFVEIFIY